MMLFPSRNIALAFAGVFLIGALAGGIFVNALRDSTLSHFFVYTSDPKTMADYINHRYTTQFQLSPDEQARIAPITRQMTQKLYSTRSEFGVDIMNTLDEYHAKIGAQMTPEHRAAYQKICDERKKRMGKMLLLAPPDSNAGS